MLIPFPGQPLPGVRAEQQEHGDQQVLGEEAKPSEDEVTSGTQETANLVSVDGTAVLHSTGPETIPWTGDVYVPLWRQDCFMGPEMAHLEQAICNQGLL